MDYVAYCGLDCEECSVYIATINDDYGAKSDLAGECSDDHTHFATEDMTCYGCFWIKNDKSKMCGDCEIRLCASLQEVKNCGECESYPCGIIERRLKPETTCRIKLDCINKQ